MNAGICVVPVSPLRREPSHRSEMVTQQLFGEACTVLEVAKDHWIKVKCSYDGYEGWCQEMHVMITMAVQEASRPSLFTAGLINAARFNDQPMYLPLGATLDAAVNSDRQVPFRYEGDTWNASTFRRALTVDGNSFAKLCVYFASFAFKTELAPSQSLPFMKVQHLFKRKGRKVDAKFRKGITVNGQPSTISKYRLILRSLWVRSDVSLLTIPAASILSTRTFPEE